MAKKSLGKGLNALINDETEIEENGIKEIEIEKIIPNQNQPRKSFDYDKIKELAESIKENGIIQPVVLRSKQDGYEIVVGERRYRAAIEAGLEKIPAVIKDYTDSKVIEIALIENIQRKDLNPIEEALAYKTIIERETITQVELSRRIGKSRSYIANMVRLLDLPKEIKGFVSRGTIAVGHARAILAIEDKYKQVELAKRIVKNGLSVREVEKLSRKKDVSRETTIDENTPYIKQIEEKLIEKLGTRVNIRYKKGKGSVVINFFSDEELNRLLESLL